MIEANTITFCVCYVLCCLAYTYGGIIIYREEKRWSLLSRTLVSLGSVSTVIAVVSLVEIAFWQN